MDMLQSVWQNNNWHIPEEMTSTPGQGCGIGAQVESRGCLSYLTNKLCRITEGADKSNPRENSFFIVRTSLESSENKNAAKQKKAGPRASHRSGQVVGAKAEIKIKETE